MNKYYSNKYYMVFLSFFIALILQIMPWSKRFDFYKPSWLFLVFVYWMIQEPCLVSIWTSFFIGIIFDSIQGSIFGTNSLSFSIIYCLIFYKNQLFKNVSLLQQTLLIALLTIFQNLIVFFIEFLFSKTLFYPQIFFNSIVNAIFWLLLFFFRRDNSINIINKS